MKKTLYDLLEVSNQASQDSIDAAYRRLSGILNPDAPDNIGNQDAATRYALIKDAYNTLSNPTRRAAYDNHLETRDTIINAEIIEPFWSGKRILLAVTLLTIAIGFISWRQIEAARLKVEEERLKTEQLNVQNEAEKAQLERQKISAASSQQSQQQSEFERARREADARQRQNDYAEQSAQRQAEYQAQRQKETEDRKRKMEEQEQERRARQEQYERERKLKQLEYERGYGKVIMLPKP